MSLPKKCMFAFKGPLSPSLQLSLRSVPHGSYNQSPVNEEVLFTPHHMLCSRTRSGQQNSNNGHLHKHRGGPVLCCAQSLSCVQLFVIPWTIACQAPLSMGILQARILEWVAMPSSRGFSQPRDRTQVSWIAGRFFTLWVTREAQFKQWNLLKVSYTFCQKWSLNLPPRIWFCRSGLLPWICINNLIGKKRQRCL